MLLLARLGLRANEVAQLKFADIDWHKGRSASAKGASSGIASIAPRGRQCDSALCESGQAIVAGARSIHYRIGSVPSVHTSGRHPYRTSALRRAGIKAPINGAHVLRHSAATTMLREGASLAGIGAVLRHRSPMTTAHYAKVDFGLLSEIAQPWPEASSC